MRSPADRPDRRTPDLGELKAAIEARGLADPAALPAEAKAMVGERLGLHQADWLASGAAPIAPEVLQFFRDLGLPLGDGWAMSENSCVGTINPPRVHH